MAITSAVSMSDWSNVFETKLSDFELHKQHEVYIGVQAKLSKSTSNPLDKALSQGMIDDLKKRMDGVKARLASPDCLNLSLQEHEFRLIQDLVHFIAESKDLERFEGDVGEYSSIMETAKAIEKIVDKGFIFEGRVNSYRYVLLDELTISKDLRRITVFEEKAADAPGQTKWQFSTQEYARSRAFGRGFEAVFLSPGRLANSVETWAKDMCFLCLPKA